MSKKRRVFDIDLPDDDLPSPETVALTPESRRGPMASAVRENADALHARSGIEAQIREENDRLAHEHIRLKKAGLITDLISTEQIDASKLIRDRHHGAADDLGELKASIKAIGLSNPIQVERNEEGRYELIQGLRRLTAWRELRAETEDEEAWGRIPATIIASGEALDKLYRRMVDENLVRKDISFGEMAILARDYAADSATSINDVDEAVLELFRSARKQKRSYIRAFAQLLEKIGSGVLHPQAISRQLGLDLRKLLEDQPVLAEKIVARLPEDEVTVLKSFLPARAGNGAEVNARPTKPRPARTTFRMERPGGSAKVTARTGGLNCVWRLISRPRIGVDLRRLWRSFWNSWMNRVGVPRGELARKTLDACA